MTIVPTEVISVDPQFLLYNHPSMPTVKYTKLYAAYHHWKAVEAAEKTAKMFGRYLVPCTLIHWERKLRWEDRRIQIGKKAFYALSKDEMTENEFNKYTAAANELAAALA